MYAADAAWIAGEHARAGQNGSVFESIFTSCSFSVHVARSGRPAGESIVTSVDSESITQWNRRAPSTPPHATTQ